MDQDAGTQPAVNQAARNTAILILFRERGCVVPTSRSTSANTRRVAFAAPRLGDAQPAVDARSPPSQTARSERKEKDFNCLMLRYGFES